MTLKYIISPISSSVASFVLKIQHLGFLAFYPTGHHHSVRDKAFSYARIERNLLVIFSSLRGRDILKCKCIAVYERKIIA